jgi:hypothetical protein
LRWPGDRADPHLNGAFRSFSRPESARW